MKNKNLIGISGRLGSGKDTVGQIINYLVWKNKIENGASGSLNHTLSDFLNNTASNTYKVKKFADKLKDIVCMLIGCTRIQLEDRDFKEKELGEEWWKYKGFREGDWIPYEEYEDMRPLVHMSHMEELVKFTPRLLLQLLGTEAGRGIIHKNIWVNSLMSEYTNLLHWVITDMRFPNELDAITKRGGISIRVERLQEINDLNPHKSETALDNAQFDYKIINNGSIHDLVEEVKKILIEQGII